MESRAAYEEPERRETRENKLNELSETEWIKFTKSWFVHRPEPRGDRKIRHSCPYQSFARPDADMTSEHYVHRLQS